MNYLKAEHLKFKRTISNKLLLIAPLLTAVFAVSYTHLRAHET